MTDIRIGASLGAVLPQQAHISVSGDFTQTLKQASFADSIGNASAGISETADTVSAFAREGNGVSAYDTGTAYAAKATGAYTADRTYGSDTAVQLDSEAISEISAIIEKTDQRLSVLDNMKEQLGGLIKQAFKDLSDPQVQSEEFARDILQFLMELVKMTGGGGKKEYDDEETADELLLRTIDEMLKEVRGSESEIVGINGVAFDTASELFAAADLAQQPEDTAGYPASVGEIGARNKAVLHSANVLQPDESDSVQVKAAENAYEPLQTVHNANAYANGLQTAGYGNARAWEASAENVNESAQALQRENGTAVHNTNAYADELQTADFRNVQAREATAENADETLQALQTENDAAVHNPNAYADRQQFTAEDNAQALYSTQRAENAQETAQSLQTAQTNDASAAQSDETAINADSAQSLTAAHKILPTGQGPETDTSQASGTQPLENARTDTADADDKSSSYYKAVAQAAESIYSEMTSAAQQAQPSVQPMGTRTAETITAADELQELAALVSTGKTDAKSVRNSLQAQNEDIGAKVIRITQNVPVEAVSLTAPKTADAPIAHAFEAGEGGAKQVVSQIVSEILNQMPEKDGETAFVMTLNPESLGRITVKLTENAGRISVAVTAERRETGELLAARLDGIQTAMKENGTDLEKFQVVYAEYDSKSEQQSYEGSSKNPYVRQTEEESEESDTRFAELLQQAL